MSREDVFSPYGKTFFVGTSALIGLTLTPNMNMAILKCISAGSSGLFMGGSTLAVGLSAIGNGYQMSTSEILSLSLSDTVWFTAAGSTATITCLFGQSSPGSTLVGL